MADEKPNIFDMHAGNADAEPHTPLAKRAGYYLTYLLVRTGMMLLQMFPIEVLQLAARGLGRLFFMLDRKHRRVALENISLSFPDWDRQHVRRTAIKSCEHMFMLAMEITSLAKLINHYNWHRYVTLVNVEPAIAHMLDNRGVMMITGHFGNWEVLGYAIGALGIRSYAVARPIDNPYLDRWLLKHRQETGQTIINKFGATDLMVKVVQTRQPLCFVADQHAGSRGVWIDYFGRPASAYKSIALLSIAQNCPIAVGGAWRLGNSFRFCAEVVDIIDPQDYADDPEAIFNITQRYNRGIEKLVAHVPEQYLWMHRRWRTPPERALKQLARQRKKQQSGPSSSSQAAVVAPGLQG